MTEADYIKAGLDLAKMHMAALFSVMLVIAWTTIQNLYTWDKAIISIAIIVNVSFCFFANKLLKKYITLMNTLKDLP